ncbi:unnamed protein product [Rotaria magnacalcarata]|uniref:NADP-dependent oxidoreductase domain-containing protein n=2 Tax=Rotaria magnacalcarata TaxID=392030 RepID=A0A819JB44_9BILA|nr:unnamed protein product [Rotaria magnacalcarata]
MEIMEAYSVARQFNLIPPICEQTEYHLFQREKVKIFLPDVFKKVAIIRIGTMTWSPLACGLLTGKYDDGVPLHSRAALKVLNEEGRKQQDKLREAMLALKLDCTVAQLAIAWCLKNENVHCVLLGASTAEQLYENINSLHIVSKLTPLLMTDIDRILGNKPNSRIAKKNETLQQQPIQR